MLERGALRGGLRLAAVLLLVPLVPFLVLGNPFESRLVEFVGADRFSAWWVPATISLLAADILLPVPSSVLGTLAGARLGIVGGTLTTWAGLSLGCLIGFAAARRWGRPLATRLVATDDLAALERLAERQGARLLVVTRALPLLAEGGVLLMGTVQLPWPQFLWSVGWSNLGLAVVYSLLGYWSQEAGHLTLAVAASIVLPLAATGLARLRGARGITNRESS